jgi:TolB-like protein/DNA-binding winged helix-turn-helix (wHTH) protein/Tfp pilus assembly protein PilF
LAQSNLVRFGAFELNLHTGELRKGGVRINLPDQPFQVLKTLLDCPGELVTRDDLRQRLWSAETFVDFEHGLNAAVRRLRDALGDSAEVPRFIETLPRRGYRFIAPVVQPSSTEEASSRLGEPTTSDALPPPAVAVAPAVTRARVLGIVATMVLVAAAVLWAFGYRSRSMARGESAGTSGRSMLAVLPFENLTGDPEQEYLSDGMTEELIAQLGRMDPSRLGVIARTSAMQFKKTTKRADEIGSELGVSHLLEGSVRTTGGRIRVAVKMIETRHQTQLWAEQYERDVRDVLALQREIAEAIVPQITSTLAIPPSHANADARRHSTIAEANEHYLRGRYYWSKDTADGHAKAIEHFRRAIDLDSSFALAHSGLADTYILLGSDGFMPMRNAYPLARTAALKALALNDELAEGHNSMAAINADYYWDWVEADRHFKRAIDLNPSYETALNFYSFNLACMGRIEEALSLARRAQRLDQVSAAAQMNVGVILHFARRYDDAVAAIKETLDLDPDFGPAYVTLGRIYVAKGMPDRAVAELERALGLMGRRPDVLTPYAYALARAGRQREARTMLDELRETAKPQAPAPVRVALVHIALGETDRAFEWLEKAIEARDWQMGLLNVEPAFDPLRSDRRFAALVERVGLPQKVRVSTMF